MDVMGTTFNVVVVHVDFFDTKGTDRLVQDDDDDDSANHDNDAILKNIMVEGSTHCR